MSQPGINSPKLWAGIVGAVVLIVFVGAPWVLSDGADAERSDEPFSDSAFVEIDGIDIHYRDLWPETEPEAHIVLLHGMAGLTYSWREIDKPLVEAGYRVVEIDLPPFGYSEPVAPAARDRSLEEIAWGVLKEVAPEVDSWTLVGHSMGASVVAKMGAEPAGEIDGMILVGGVPHTADTHRDLNTISSAVAGLGLTQEWIRVIAGRQFLDHQGLGELMESACGTEQDEAVVEEYLAPLKVTGTPGASIRQVLNAKTVAPDEVPEYPTLLLWGRHDDWVPVEEAEKLTSVWPHARLEVIDDAAHCPMETHPGEFLEIVVPFLQEFAG